MDKAYSASINCKDFMQIFIWSGFVETPLLWPTHHDNQCSSRLVFVRKAKATPVPSRESQSNCRRQQLYSA